MKWTKQLQRDFIFRIHVFALRESSLIAGIGLNILRGNVKKIEDKFKINFHLI
jgi:hypothetical protein